MQTPEQGPPIRLAAFTFDPVEEKLDLPGESSVEKAPGEPAHYILQFSKSLTREERARVQGRYGLKLTDYIPELAYLERLSPRTLDALTKDPLFRAAVPFRPAFKISPDIGTLRSRSAARRDAGGLLLNATLFLDADPLRVEAMLKELGATGVRVLDNRGVGGPVQVRFALGSKDVLPRVAASNDVRWIEEVPELKEDNVNTAGTLQSGAPGTQSIWAQGLHGEEQIIGVIDLGPLDIAHCFFRDTPNTPGPAHRKVPAIRNASGTAAGRHATFVAGCAAGDDIANPGGHTSRGGAWAARLISGNTDDLLSSTLLAELSAAAEAGAFIHTNSWHYNTGIPATYNQAASDVDGFTWNNEDHLVLGSAGNSGEEQGPPGTAKNAICVAASQADPNEMDFGDGNDGPTADGRRKPDLVAPGCGIHSATVATPCDTGPRPACATSYATPHAAAAVALVRQYLTEGYYPTGTPQPHHAFTPSGALMKAVLLNGTIDMTGVAGYPSDTEGWGLIRLRRALSFPGGARGLRVWDTRNLDGMFTGDVRTHHVDVAADTQALKVTLVWTEPPSSAGNATPVVNDLDLEVVSPDGAQTFRGNVFAGGVSTTGGSADSLNNVEMVLVNAPAPGDWTLRVTATQVNVGNPGQGYALTATGVLTEAPVAPGIQDTLVVRVRFADVAFDPSLPNLQNLMVDVADYIDRVSYGQTTVIPAFRGPLDLDHDRDYYHHPDRNPLIELTEEVVAKLEGAEPDVFTGLERMIIVTNHGDFTGDWATTGPWPYAMPAGFTRPISVSIQSYADPAARFTHGLLHQFGLVDLYAHEGVTFPRPYVDEWDNMAGTYNNVHPLVWSKERAGWLTAHGSTIHYIPRPAPGASYTGLNPIPLFRNTSATANRKAIAIGLSQGAATLAAENAFYFVEARNNAANYDSGLPGSGVLIYYVNELIPQGEGPVILRDRNSITPGLGDAFFNVGDVVPIPGTGITLTVQAGTGGAPFAVQVDYIAPVADYNVFITRGETIDARFYPWFSPDIWIDSPRNGFDLGGGPPPHDQRDHPVAGLENRIYARIHNAGPATAFDFDVRFRISEPYHTVGGEADFDRFVGIRHIASLGPGHTDVFVPWTPETGGDPHVCVKVDLINLVGTDTNEHDNWAQENLEVVPSVTASPFHPVTYSYNLTNPYARAALFYFRAEGTPKDWAVNLVPRKIRLNPGERMTGTATIAPPEGAQVCTSQRIEITSWTPRGDTLINLGGAVVQVDLRRPTTIKLEADMGPGEDQDWKTLLKEAKGRGDKLDPDVVRKRCGRLVVQGGLVPPQAGVELILKYVDPLGKVVYRTVKAGQNGCFKDFFVSVTGGTWQVSVEYPGGECEAPEVEGPITVCWCRE